MRNLYQQAPCANCPFRKDAMVGWLGRERVTGILSSHSFVCHKSLDKGPRKQCCGHMLLRKNNNVFFNTAKRLGVKLKLKGHDLVFDSVAEAIEHHAEESIKGKGNR